MRLTISPIFFVFMGIALMLLPSCNSSLPEDVEAAFLELPEQVDFNYHIRPILSDRCWPCHGPDKNARKGELRLDAEASAFAALASGDGHAFMKNGIGKSIALQRMISEEEEYKMPPTESNLVLSAKEIAMVAKWIKQGAKWKKHWAFIPPEKPTLPDIKTETPQVYNPIDHFILVKLEENGLNPAEAAQKERLLRRVTMDLTACLPPLKK